MPCFRVGYQTGRCWMSINMAFPAARRGKSFPRPPGSNSTMMPETEKDGPNNPSLGPSTIAGRAFQGPRTRTRTPSVHPCRPHRGDSRPVSRPGHGTDPDSSTERHSVEEMKTVIRAPAGLSESIPRTSAFHCRSKDSADRSWTGSTPSSPSRNRTGSTLNHRSSACSGKPAAAYSFRRTHRERL